jgi:hypothetical protein
MRARHGQIEQQQIDVLFRFKDFPRVVDRAGLESFRDWKGEMNGVLECLTEQRVIVNDSKPLQHRASRPFTFRECNMLRGH